MIELGVPEDHEPGPPPAPPWLREWGVRRPLAVLAAAVVCLALLGAAAPARPEVPVRSIGGLSSQDGYQIFGDTLLAFHWGSSSGITAYDLTTGGIRWARSLANSLEGLEDLGDAVLVSTSPQLLDPQNPTQEQLDANLAASVVTAYAVDTGEVRWTRRGSLYSAADRKVALIRPPGQPGRLEAVEAVGGTTRWSRPLQPEGSWQLGWRPRNSLYGGYADGLIELAKDGTVTLVDLATGAVTHTAHVPPGGDLSLAWNGVLGVRYGPVTPTGDPGVDRHITFFDLDGGLTQLWTMAIPQSDLSPCSPDEVCSWGPDPTPRRFDLRTGQDITARSAQQLSLVDRFQTGQIGIWRVVGGDEDHTLVYSAPTPVRRGWVGQLDLTDPAPRVRPLMWLTPVDQCLTGVQWLVCLSNTATPSGQSIAYAVRRADLAAEPRLRATSGADLRP